MTRTMSGYNSVAKKGRQDAVNYCMLWKDEIAKERAAIEAEYSRKIINLATYNKERDKINKSAADLNACIASINKQFGMLKK
ncbi:MAG: F-BAR domain-containing protein [Defluviitaleaceae bacterium]|nr:F-BAR domain-containing protein [Defluviitaleaceae bacterium]